MAVAVSTNRLDHICDCLLDVPALEASAVVRSHEVVPRLNAGAPDLALGGFTDAGNVEECARQHDGTTSDRMMNIRARLQGRPKSDYFDPLI
jgi:hypothetical protein